MKKQQRVKVVREGRFLAEVNVELLVTDDEWSPYLSPEDAYKLDDVREALKKEDTATPLGMVASTLSRQLLCSRTPGTMTPMRP